MKKQFLILLFVIIHNIYAQDNILENYNECEQYQSIVVFLERNSDLKTYYNLRKIRLQIDTLTLFPSNFFDKLAILRNMVSLEKSIPFEEIEIDTVKKYKERFKEGRHNKINTECIIHENRKSNVSLRIFRLNEKYVIVKTKKKYRKALHSYGYYYIFKFEENLKFRYRKYSWIQ